MVTVHLGPKWFFGIDSGLEAFASLIAFCVTLASYKMWKFTKERKYLYFSTSFLLLTLSFAARAITDAIIEGIFFKLPEQHIAYIFLTGYVLHILLALTAYIILFTVTFNITQKSVIALIFLILVPSLLISSSYYLSFYGLSAILLAFITYAYFKNYRKVCKNTACMVFISFVILTIAQVLFLVEIRYKPSYVIAQLTQATGYLALLYSLIRALLK